MVKFAAMLDPPSERSFGMVAFLVIGDELAEPMVIGMAGGNRPLGHDPGYTLEMFINAGHAHAVPHQDITFSEVPTGQVVGWLGHAFLAECLRLRLPRPETAGVTYEDAKGIFWIEPSEDCYARLERWTLAVAPRATQERSREMVALMGQCLPFHEATLAAVKKLR